MVEATANRKTGLETVSAGSSVEGIAGAIAIVLAILALANVLSQPLIAVAVIVLGAGLLIRGAAITIRYSSLMSAVSGRRLSLGQLGFGAGVEMLAGAAGIVLGILVLLGVAAGVLASVAMIVLGAALAMTSVTNLTLRRLGTAYAGPRADPGKWGVRTGSVLQLILGLIAIALGIVALVGVPQLNRIAVLVLGVGIVLAGTAVGFV